MMGVLWDKENVNTPVLDKPESEIDMIGSRVKVGRGGGGRGKLAASKAQSGANGLGGSKANDSGIKTTPGKPVSSERWREVVVVPKEWQRLRS